MFSPLLRFTNVEQTLNNVCSSETLVKEFRSNTASITEIGNIIDRISAIPKGTAIIELRAGKKSQIIVLSKTDNLYLLTICGKDHAVDLGTSIILHEFSDKSIDEFLQLDTLLQTGKPLQINRSIFLDFSLRDTPLGLRIIPARAKELIKLLSTEIISDQTKYTEKLYLDVKDAIAKSIHDVEIQYEKFVTSLSEPALDFKIDLSSCPNPENVFVVGEITKVIEAGNHRFYQINYKNSSFWQGTLSVAPNDRGTSKYIAKKGIYVLDIGRRYYSHYNELSERAFTVEDIPYELVDEGRKIVLIRFGYYIHGYISEDPKVNPENNSKFVELLYEELKRTARKEADIDQTTIGEFHVSHYIQRKDDDEENSNFQALKKMINEYRYIIQKQKSKGKDISITDKIKYSHDKGKITYGDFSIATDNELMKNNLQEFFNTALLQYYRGEKQEEVILNSAIERFLESLRISLLSVTKESTLINITINNKISIKVESRISSNKNRLFYINDQRINQNEICLMVKEVSCFRDAATVETFLSNVGRLGLAVYIGITSGYTLSNRIFKFRKLEGRSNYDLILHNTTIRIKGKKILTHLYEAFLEKLRAPHRALERFDSIIRESVLTTGDFIRYRLLIDETYTSFKKQSEEVIAKKILELEGQKVQFKLKKSLKEAVLMKGLSGNHYVIAFDNSGSWVFMNPTRIEESDVYENGFYVCMVDQSSIKSSFNYDTVIAKMMALKNDSVIAKQIYNLDEAIGASDEKEGDSD